MLDNNGNKLCEEFCDDHKLQQKCLEIMKNNIKDESIKREALTAKLGQVEQHAHERMDTIDHNFANELRVSTDKITTELKSIDAGLRLMLSNLKDDTNKKLEGVKDKINSIKDEIKSDYRREIESARTDREKKIEVAKIEVTKELGKKVPFWAFYVMLFLFLTSIGGLYGWQWRMSEKNQEWQKCVSSEFNANIGRINEAVTSLSRVIVEETYSNKQNADNIKRHETEVKTKIERLEIDINALRQKNKF